MKAVLIEIDVQGVDAEEGTRALQERIVPMIAGMPGFRCGTWLTGGEHNLGLSLTVWSTEEAARAFAERFPVGASPQSGSSVRRCEVREVAAVRMATDAHAL